MFAPDQLQEWDKALLCAWHGCMCGLGMTKQPNFAQLEDVQVRTKLPHQTQSTLQPPAVLSVSCSSWLFKTQTCNVSPPC